MNPDQLPGLPYCSIMRFHCIVCLCLLIPRLARNLCLRAKTCIYHGIEHGAVGSKTPFCDWFGLAVSLSAKTLSMLEEAKQVR